MSVAKRKQQMEVRVYAANSLGYGIQVVDNDDFENVVIVGFWPTAKLALDKAFLLSKIIGAKFIDETVAQEAKMSYYNNDLVIRLVQLVGMYDAYNELVFEGKDKEARDLMLKIKEKKIELNLGIDD